MSTRGFTLLELMVVMALIALVAGLSASAFQVARRNYALSASASEIQGVLRTARNTSVSTSTPSFVVVDPVRRVVWAQSFETAGEWSFDDAEEPRDGAPPSSPDRIVGAEAVDGRVGRALIFQEPGAHVDCGNAAAFNLQGGVEIEAWVRHDLASEVRPPLSERRVESKSRRLGGAEKAEVDDRAPARAIVAKEGAYFLGMTEGGALEGAVGDYRMRTTGGVVAPGRWVHVALVWDGAKLALAADGVERPATSHALNRTLAQPARHSRSLARAGNAAAKRDAPEVPPPAEVPLTPYPLTISSPKAGFPGAIDEVRLRGRTHRLTYSLPEGQHVVGWKKVVHFDRQGHLDAAHHDDPVRIVLVELGDREIETVAKSKTVGAVDYSILFEEWISRWPEGSSRPTQSEEEARIVAAAYKDSKRVDIVVDSLGVLR